MDYKSGSLMGGGVVCDDYIDHNLNALYCKHYQGVTS